MLSLCSHGFRHKTEQSHWNMIIFFHSAAFFGSTLSTEIVTLSDFTLKIQWWTNSRVFKEHRMQTREKRFLEAKFKIYNSFSSIIVQNFSSEEAGQ